MRRLPPKKVNAVSGIILAIGVVIGLIGAIAELNPLTAAGVLVMFGSIVFRWICFRCPHCGKYLDRSTGDFCPYCGKDVNH